MTDEELNAQPEPSLHDDLASAFEAASTADAPADGVQPVAQIPAPTEQPQAGETAQQAADRARDEQGRFAKAGEAVQTKSEPNAQAGQGTPQGAIAAPATWSATAKSKFATLDPVIQQEVLKREKDVADGLAQWQTKGERLNRLDEILAPRRERFQLAGIDEVRAVQALFAAQDLLERQPYEAIAHLARNAGVDLRRFAQGVPGQAQQAPMPPEMQRVLDEVSSLKGVVAQQQQHAQQEARSYFGQQVQAFAADPKNPYFANVEADMTALITSGQAKTLQEAYDRATWAHPEIRPLLMADQAKAQAVATEQAARAKAAAARQASGSITGSPTPGSAPASRTGPQATPADDLRETWSELVG